MKKNLLITFLAIITYSCSNDNDVDDALGDLMTVESTPVFSQQAYPDIEGELIALNTTKGETINLRKVGQEYVWQGDIVLSESQVEELFLDNRSETSRTAVSTFLKYWPRSIVYFTLNANLPTKTRNEINDAINHWRAQAPYMTFIARTNETNFIEFVTGSGCSSSGLGMIGGKQNITLSTSCDFGSAVHEIGHAVGLLHEQTRTDRNNSITVNYSNIRPEKRSQFDIYTQRGIAGFQIPTFDFNSIMLYPARIQDPAFVYNTSINTMTRLDGTTWNWNTTTLSVGDLEIINQIYGGQKASLSFTTTDVSGNQTDSHWYQDVYVNFPQNLTAAVSFRYLIEKEALPSRVKTITYHTISLSPGNKRFRILNNFVREELSYGPGGLETGSYKQSISSVQGFGYID